MNWRTLSIKTKVESFGTVTYLFSQPFFYKTLTSSNPRGCSDCNIEISSNSHILAGREEYWSLLDDNHIRITTDFNIQPIDNTLRNGFGIRRITSNRNLYLRGESKMHLYRFPEMTQLTTFEYQDLGASIISPNGHILVETCSGYDDPGWKSYPAELSLWSLPDGKQILDSGTCRSTFFLGDESTQLYPPKFTPDSQVLIVASDRGVFLFTFSLSNNKYPLSVNKKYIDCKKSYIVDGHNSVEISTNGKILVSREERNDIALISLPDGNHLKTLKGHNGIVTSIVISPNSRILASSSWEDNTVRLWSLPDGNHLKTLKGHNGIVTSIVISPNSRILASISYDRTIHLWSLPDGNHLKTLTGLDETVRKLLISPDSRILAAYGGADSTICLWSLPDGNHLKTLTGHPNWSQMSLAFSPDGRFLASTWEKNTIRLWSLPDKNYHPSINKFTTQDIADIESKINDPKLEESVRNAFKFTLALIDLRKQFDINAL